jgi:hypothetical protein
MAGPDAVGQVTGALAIRDAFPARAELGILAWKGGHGLAAMRAASAPSKFEGLIGGSDGWCDQ